MAFRKQTDLQQVKQVAKLLLMQDIEKTSFSPMVVSHPFTSSGIAMIQTDGSPKMLNIAENADDFSIWRNQMEKLIEGKDSAFKIYMLVNKPYSLCFLKYAKPYLSQSDFSQILGSAWVREENPGLDPNVTKRQLVAMFQSATPLDLMGLEDYRAFNSLPEMVTVYRGVTPYNEKNVKALAWTIDQKVAEWFASRFDQKGTVYKAIIPKKHVLAYFSSRSESEVIIDPKFLQSVEKVTV